MDISLVINYYCWWVFKVTFIWTLYELIYTWLWEILEAWQAKLPLNAQDYKCRLPSSFFFIWFTWTKKLIVKWLITQIFDTHGEIKNNAIFLTSLPLLSFNTWYMINIYLIICQKADKGLVFCLVVLVMLVEHGWMDDSKFPLLVSSFWQALFLICKGPDIEKVKKFTLHIKIHKLTVKNQLKLNIWLVLPRKCQKIVWVGGFVHGSVGLHETTIFFCPA